MPRLKLSLPHERRKASLKSTALRLRVRAAEIKEQLRRTNDELAAMKPPRKPSDL